MKPIRLLILALLLIIHHSAFADLNMDPADSARFGQAQSLNNLQRFMEASPILDELIKKYPDNQNVRTEYIKAHGYNQNLLFALKEIEDLEKHNPDDQEILTLKASILEANQKFEQAIVVYKDLLRVTGQEPEQILEIIRKIARNYFLLYDYLNAISYLKQINTEELNIEDRFIMAECYIQLNNPENAIVLLESEIDRDQRFLVKLMKAYFDLNKQEKVRDLIDNHLKLENLNKKEGLEIVDLLAGEKLHSEAIKLCEKLLVEYPNDIELLTRLARIESWNKNYKQSLSLYDTLIDQTSKNPMFFREKARVLGWMREYKASIDQYEYAQKEFPSLIVVSLEKEAKKNLFKEYNQNASLYYEKWLLIEPENMEALFDLAQVYSRQGLYEEAEQKYLEVLDLYKQHPQAKQALKKLKAVKDDLLWKTKIESYEADSSSRSNDHKYLSLSNEISIPVSDKVRVGLSNEEKWNMFSDLSLVHQNIAGLNTSIVINSKFKAKFAYANNNYSDAISSTNDIKAELNFQPWDFLHFNYLYSHEDIIDNRTTLVNGLNRDESTVQLTGLFSRRLQAKFNYKYADLSDGNEREDYKLRLNYHLLIEPKRLTFQYEYEKYSYDQPSANYFSPSSFHANRIGLEWQHYLNKEEMFWGGNDTYYLLGYGVNFDVNDQTGHTLKVGAGKDWSHQFSTKIEYFKQIYEHQGTYRQEGFSFTGYYYF